ncbi:EAL domain, c-di-GMP-specific phosphodiesterase class I (or its enzymatically inactive variant) [Fibrobacter sp. UWT2]|uniref:EAL domain-containing protein n=1 Tax=Fibrobacter sp. UWT2 TaxID=1896224 RepID=UPI00091776BA|nr:EAL domain-containing protein [Fibrobacter sp. UWT2]SHK62630.1 EAL domain, c-di-GMP-specific phosphodiesterase class I (or its enzymatically inactive variant) [Fibrobacter sp. UWT2]
MTLRDKSDIPASVVVDLLNTAKVDPFVIFDAKTHEIYMVNPSMSLFWKPKRPYEQGIKFEEYFFPANEQNTLFVEELLEKGVTIIRCPYSGKDLVVEASQISWNGKRSIFMRVNDHSDRFFDSLTGLPNLEYCRIRGENYVEGLLNAGKTPAVVFFDIIGMKLYNNANGFSSGNEFLIHFAAVLKKQFADNLVCRSTNDHFVVVADIANLEEKLREVRKYVKGTVSKISMDLYVGICQTDTESDILDAIEKAKLACNIQKKKGDKFIRQYDEDLHRTLLLHNYVVNHIDDAIANGYIKVYYQPVVRTISETFCGMEALARWIDPEQGFLNPGEFIGALEESKQIHKLDSHVIELVCREMREQLDQGYPVVPVSFNLSRLDFTGCDIFEVVEGILERYKIERDYIRVEITESIMASDSYIQHEIERFRLVGYEVWMDDFGSGYSSLNTLKDYKFDELKIDMAFLSNFNEVSRTIISSMVRMAKSLGLKTLAEGVETKEQMEFLKSIGCEKVQGYYYGKPQPLKATMEHMETSGIVIEDSNTRAVYSKIGRLDYQENTPRAIMSFENGIFKFLFVNKQYEEQLLSLGFKDVQEVEDASNNPENPVYYTLHEAERAAYEAPCEVTYVTHGMYVFMKGRLIADNNGCHIYDLSFRNTHVSAHESSSRGKEVALPANTKTILIAEANPQERAFLESILRSDYHVLLAENGEQALSLLLEYGRHVALALINANLPKMDGFKLIQNFQTERRNLQIPFVVMTDNMDLAKESIRIGATQFLLTPIKDRGMLKAKIDGSIKNAEELQQLALNYMEFVPGGVVLFSVKTGEILYANARVLDMLECHSIEEFRTYVGRFFKNAILPEDYGKINAEISEQVTSRSTATKQLTFRVKTTGGKTKRVYHVGKVFGKTPYGTIFSAFMSEDDLAMKAYFNRKDAFEKFMASGVSTNSKSYDPGYRGFLFWNLTKNSPVLRMGGISYIPKELEDKYTYEIHYRYLSSLMLQNETNVINSLDYTRDKLILDYMNKCMVHAMDISYDVAGFKFTIRSSFDMMMDPETGDIILKLQNDSIKTTKK